MNEGKIKAAIYARVSTGSDLQAKSLDIQMESIQEICRLKGYEVVKIYEEKAKSGTNIRRRSQYREMMHDCGLNFMQVNEGTDQFVTTKRDPLYGIIFVKDASRFSRNITEAIETIKRLIEMKVNVNFVNLGIDTLSDGDWEDRLTMAFMMANSESRVTSRRIKSSLRHRANSKIYNPSKPPYGYTKIKNDDGTVKFEIIEEQAEIVRRIFKEYLENGTQVIIGRLNKEGIKTEAGRHWTQKRADRMLKNTAYYGSPTALKTTKINVTDTRRVKTDKDSQVIIPDALPSIIPRELFEQCQRVRASRTNAGAKMGLHKPTDDMYYSKVFCQSCGSRFVRNKITVTSHTYICKSKRLKTGCTVSNISLKQLNKYMEESNVLIDDLKNHVNYTELMEKLNNGIKQRNVVINELNKKIKTHEEDNELNFDKMKRAKTEEIELMFQKSITDNHIAIADCKNRIDEMNIAVLEQLKADIVDKKNNIERIKKSEIHLLEDKLEFVNKISVDDDYVRVEYKTPDFMEEFERFNELFKGTEYEATYFSGNIWHDDFIRNEELAKELREQDESWAEAVEQGHI